MTNIIKIHKIKYSKSGNNYFDITEMKIQLVNETNKMAPMSRLSKIGLSFVPEQIDDVSFSDRSSDLSIISEEKSLEEAEQKNHDAEIIEYFPSVFQVIRNNYDITDQMLGNSLSPNNNKNFKVEVSFSFQMIDDL